MNKSPRQLKKQVTKAIERTSHQRNWINKSPRQFNKQDTKAIEWTSHHTKAIEWTSHQGNRMNKLPRQLNEQVTKAIEWASHQGNWINKSQRAVTLLHLLLRLFGMTFTFQSFFPFFICSYWVNIRVPPPLISPPVQTYTHCYGIRYSLCFLPSPPPPACASWNMAAALFPSMTKRKRQLKSQNNKNKIVLCKSSLHGVMHRRRRLG